VEREMVVPVFAGDVIKAILGVGNKETDYTSEDVEVLSLIANLAWEIVERKIAHNELNIAKITAEHNFTKMTEAQAIAKTGSWDWDIKNNLLSWSDEVYKIFGLTPAAFKPTTNDFQNFIHPDDREAAKVNYESHLSTRIPYNKVHRIVLADKSVKYVNERCISEFDNDGNPLRSSGTIADITEQRLAQIELERAKEKAEESDRLKSAFINNISHEIRTPLNAILGFGSFLAEMDVSEDERTQMLARVQQSSDRLLNTMTDYMDMAMIFSGTMKVHYSECSLNQLLDKLKSSLDQFYIDHCIDLEIDLKPGPGDLTMTTDPEIICKILNELMDNAIKFTKKGSIVAGYHKKTDFVEFFVRDSGIGIDKKNLGLIFKMFNQGDTSMTRGYEGSGLGLSIAGGLAKLLGGSISVTSEKEKGSTFTLTIPYAETKISEITAPAEGKNDAGAGRPLVLLAEDDDANYLYMEKVIKNAGCDYLLAKNGAEAVECCQQHPDITLVLMDIKMPVMNGLEATRLIRGFRPELPIIATTAYAQTGDEQRFLDAGCNGYLAKPIKKDKLLALIQKYF
jgi:PAS domain S-box-containing protein